MTVLHPSSYEGDGIKHTPFLDVQRDCFYKYDNTVFFISHGMLSTYTSDCLLVRAQDIDFHISIASAFFSVSAGL